MILTAAGINYIMKGLLPKMIQVKEKAHGKPVVYRLQNNERKHSPIEHTDELKDSDYNVLEKIKYCQWLRGKAL